MSESRKRTYTEMQQGVSENKIKTITVNDKKTDDKSKDNDKGLTNALNSLFANRKKVTVASSNPKVTKTRSSSDPIKYSSLPYKSEKKDNDAMNQLCDGLEEMSLEPKAKRPNTNHA